MDNLVIPGFASQEESLQALRRTTPELAMLALMGQTSGDEFLCIGRDECGEPIAVVVPAGDFLNWFDAHAADPDNRP